MIEIGTILDNTYKVLDNIGAGGGGEIYLAEHLRLEKKVVIKKIKDKARGVIEDRGEADILKKLRHPYLPQVYDHYTSEEHVYTVMEYMEGKNFQELLKEGKRFSSKDIVKWGTQLSEALVYLHKQDPPRARHPDRQAGSKGSSASWQHRVHPHPPDPWEPAWPEASVQAQ